MARCVCARNPCPRRRAEKLPSVRRHPLARPDPAQVASPAEWVSGFLAELPKRFFRQQKELNFSWRKRCHKAKLTNY